MCKAPKPPKAPKVPAPPPPPSPTAALVDESLDVEEARLAARKGTSQLANPLFIPTVANPT
jgi:hypothetical protein